MALARSSVSSSFRENYEQGVDVFYQAHGSAYRNPHEPTLRRVFRRFLGKWMNEIPFQRTLDLACGSGEATIFMKEYFEKRGYTISCGPITEADPKEGEIHIEGADPFTSVAYENRLGVPASTFSFEDIEGGILQDREVQYDTVICCYAFHLVEPSRLFSTCQPLAMAAKHLIIISPHKKPDITSAMGWNLRESLTEERVHVRLYDSLFC